MGMLEDFDSVSAPKPKAASMLEDFDATPSLRALGVQNPSKKTGDFDAGPAIDMLTSYDATPTTANPAKQGRTPAGNSSSLPDTHLGRAAAGAVGLYKGATDLLIQGPAQLITNAAADVYPKHWPGSDFIQRERDTANKAVTEGEERFKSLTRDVAPAAGASGEVAGNIVGALTLPQSKAAEGANIINRMIAAAKSGAVAGLATPVQDEVNYWKEKALQTGVGATAGALFLPVAEGAGKVIGYGASKAMDIGRRVMSWAGGAKPDAAVEKVIENAGPELKQTIQNAVSKGEKIDPASLGRQVEADSLPVKIKLTAGQAKQDPIAISQEMNLRSKNPALVYHYQEQNNSLIQNLNHIRESAAPDAAVPDAITAGENLIKSGQATLDKQRDLTSALYKKLADANGGNLPIDGIAFADTASAALKKNMKGAFLPPEVKGIIEGFKSGEQPMTFENFENLRTILASASRSAERAGNGNTVGAIHLVRDALEATPISSEVAGVKQLADAARASAKFGFDLLEKNPALKAIDSGKAADNNFVQKYIIGASKKDITGLAESLQHDPEALQTIKAGTINYLKSAAGVASDNGNFTQHGYNKALQALGPKLDVIFGAEEAAQLRKVGNVARYTQAAPRGSYVNSSNTDVANLARSGAADVAARAVDRFTGMPIGSMAKNAAQSVLGQRASARELNEVMRTGAGTTSPSAANDALLKRFPARAGQTGSVALSAIAAQGATKKKP